MRRRLMALLLALMVAFGGLTACGGGGEGVNENVPLEGQTDGGGTGIEGSDDNDDDDDD